MTLAPLTRLDAVNTMLSAIGESPVNSLGDSGVADADLAERIINEVSAEVQAMGLQCNRDINWPLVPDVDGYITVPSNAIRVDTYGQSASVDITVRAGKVYDIANRTNIWTQTLYCEIIWLFEFEELPEAVRRYITVRAARKLQDRALGHAETHQYNAEDEAVAKALMLEAESDVGDYTVFDNFDTFRTIDR